MKPLTMSPAEVLREVEASLSFLRSRGLPVNPSSRFAQMFRLLREHSVRAGTEMVELRQAIQDTFQLGRIASAFHDRTEQPFLDKLATVIDDPMLPERSKAETPGRDYQFELFLAATLSSAGLEVSFEEPDVVASLSGLHFGFAAKRPKDAKRLERRMKEAVDQLATAGSPDNPRITHGFVALDVTWLGNPAGTVAVVDSMAHGAESAEPVTRGVADFIESDQMMDRLLDGRDSRVCTAVVLFAAVTMFGRDGGLGNSINFRVLDRASKNREALDILMGRLTAE